MGRLPGPSGASRLRSRMVTRCASSRPWRAADVAAGPHAHAGAHAHAHAQAHADLAPHGGRYESILDAIGHTPLVAIPRMSPNPAVRIYAKLEFLNPTRSVKDRPAKALIEDLGGRGG